MEGLQTELLWTFVQYFHSQQHPNPPGDQNRGLRALRTGRRPAAGPPAAYFSVSAGHGARALVSI